MSSTVSLDDVTIISVVFASVACVVTAVRLVERTRTKRLWWDDACAAVSMLGLLGLIVATERHYSQAAVQYGSTVGASSYYAQAYSFYIAVWSARLAILFTIIRITPTQTGKRVLLGVAAVFGIIVCLLFAQELWICERNTAWKQSTPPPQCPLGLQSAVVQLATDAVSDLIIVIVPLRLLARAHISFQHRLRLMAIFTMSVATTIVSIAHAAYLIEGIKIAVIFTAIIEAGVSLIVCNLAVIVPATVRLFSREPAGPEETDETRPNPQSITAPLPESTYPTELHILSFDETATGKAPSLSSAPFEEA